MSGGFCFSIYFYQGSILIYTFHSPNAQKLRIKEAHKKIMLINHPDRGGSPYIASKINEGKKNMINLRQSIQYLASV